MSDKKGFWSRVGKRLYDMLSSDNSDTLSNARVQSFVLFCVGLILLILHFCGIGSNADVAYTMVGIGTAEGTIKSVSSVITHKEDSEK